VVPFFQEQIARGGPVTVTHPDCTRYFMTIPEAVQLVLQATLLGQGGEIFMLNMGEPVKILDLARDLIRLAGFQEDEIPIVFTGLRPGEKLHEELFTPEEHHRRTAHQKIFVFTDGRTAETETELLETEVQRLITAAQQGDLQQIFHLLQTVVPEYLGGAKTDQPFWTLAATGQTPAVRKIA
jgi:FlaA1/EpsC-like NDP-sugar epimerase